MIRYSLLAVVLAGIMVYSWRDWYRALCLLIVLVAVLERPDMPHTMLGIQGLNPFNICLAGILIAWAFCRDRRLPMWDAPRWFTVAFSLFSGVMVIGSIRLLLDPSSLQGTVPGLARYTTSSL